MKSPLSFLILVLFLIPNLNFGQAPSLGVANSFAVFTAVGAFSNSGATVVTGDIGTDVGLFSGFPPGVVMGTIHVADPVADQAAVDVASAYMFLDGLTCGTVLGVTLGGGQMLTPDIYCIGAAATLNGTLTLDGQGDPNSMFIFQIDGALATGILANVVLINGASLCNVYWQVNGAFTLGDGSTFRGNVLANGAIHLLEASSLFGRALSQGGAVDLHNNIIGIGLPPIAAVITANGPTTFCAGGSVTLSGNIDGVWSNGSVTPTILVNSSGDYFVVNTTLCGSDTSNHIIVTVVPDLPPFISCPADVVIQCTAGTLPANTGTATASDNCGAAPTLVFNDITVQGACPQAFTITRTWTATDATGNTSNCIQTISVIDNTAPVITCPTSIVIECTASTLPASTGTATALDNCDLSLAITSSDVIVPSQNCLQSYTILRTWTATDDCGNNASCVQTINVVDTTPPIIFCPPNVTIACGNNTLPANTGSANATDACDPLPVITFTDVTIPANGCPSITRTWTAEDECGNISTCTQSIVVTNSTTISITCPGAVAVQCASQLPAVNTSSVITSGTCGGVITVTFVGDVISNQTCANRFTVTRTYIASDLCGNVATCTQAITVLDNTPPSITCPVNITVQCASQVPLPNPAAIVTADNCGGLATVSFVNDIINNQTCANRFNIIRTYLATDACGNTAICTHTITVFDNTPPSITCPGNITVQCASQVPVSNPATIVTADNCGGLATVTFIGDVISNLGCANRFNVTRTYRSTDACGNFLDCNQTITVFDNTPPSITCPGNITVQCATQVPVANPATIVTADNCGGLATVTFIGDAISNLGCTNRFNVTRTYRSTDACGNFFDCNQTITVFDNTPPSITCPGNITVQCATQVPVANPATIVTADNCGGLATVTFIGDVISNLGCTNRFNVTRTYRSTDACGNFFDCNQTITVFDNTPPSITCPVNITVQCASQVPVANPASIVTADNCGGAATVTFAGDIVSNFVCTNQFVVNRTYVAADACGNTAVCTQQIRVFDNSAISILCPGNVTVSCASLVPAVNLNLGVVSNACGGTTTVSLLSAVISNQTCTNRFTLTRTYLATDACAQSASCVQVITVLDNTPPVITLPNGLVNGGTLDVQCFGQDPNWDLPVFGPNDVTAADNCTGAVTVTFAQVLEDEGTCATDGYINLFRLTWTATDECGNSSTAFLHMALIDTIPPVIHGIPADITVNCDSIPLPPTIVFATDECLCACVLFVNETQPVAGCADGQVILRTWTAKDRCGNQTTETQRITLVNNQPPTLHLLQPEMTGLNDGSLLEYTCSEGGIPAFINALSAVSIVSTSTCGDAVNVTFDRKVIDANNCDFSGFIQQQILHWQVVDLCGNVASMTVTVNLIDNQAPEFIGLPSLACIGDPSLANVEAIDNCGEAHVRFWDLNIPNPCGEGTAVRRTYEAYDDCGNMARDTVILIPNDQSSPNLEFVNPMLDSLGAGEIMVLNCAAHDQQMTLFGTADVVSNDPCAGPVNLSFQETLLSSGDCSEGSNVALMQLLWTATDVCGNLSTLTATASVEDKTSPVFVDFRAVVGIGCNDSLPVYVASDNCGSVVITTSDRYFYSDCPSKYYIERQITATDPCGNATVAFQTINVGGGGPVITGVTEDICDDLNIPDVTAFDECTGVAVNVTMVQDTLEEACRGLVIQRTWTAVDACGDTTTIIQHIFVGDTIAPVIGIPSYSILIQFLDVNHNVVYLSQEELMKKIDAFDENTISVSDDCGLVILPVFTVVVTNENCLLTGFVEHRVYTWVATDICGNSSSITITIDVIDDTPPVITGVPNDTTIVCAPLPVVPVVQADGTVVFTESTTPDDGTGIFVVTRTWTSTDACGNVTVVVQYIKWIPNSLLTCNINVPAQVDCNSHDVVITSDVTGGTGPFTYVWQIVGNKCFIQGGQGTPEITIYMGWEDVKIILTVTDAFGCQSMCMYVLHCLEPGEQTYSSNPAFADPETNSNTISVAPASVLNHDQGIYLKDLNLWPNPAKGTVNISFTSSIEQEVVFSFVNFLGQVIMSDRMDVHKGINSRKIDIDQVAGGSYMMEVKSDKEMLTKVVVIMP